MARKSRAWMWTLVAWGAWGCLDELKEPFPVAALRAPGEPFEVERGRSVELSIQALDSELRGVNGAHVAFALGDAARIVFDGASDDGVDAVTRVTAAGRVAGLEVEGVATVRVFAPNEAEFGVASVVAVVRAPTPDDENAVSGRIDVTVVEGDSEPDAGVDGGMGS